MKRTIFLILLLLASGSAALAQNRVKLQGIVERGNKQIVTSGLTSTTKSVQSYPGATVTIYLTGTTTLASLCSDNLTNCTSQANPFTASSSDASWSAYLTAGIFDVRFSGTGITTPWTISAVNTGLSSTSTVAGGNVTRVAKLVVTPTYTVLAADAGKQLVFSNAGAVAVTLPQAGTGSFTTGYWVDASVIGGGTVTITPATSTINGATTLSLTSGSGVSGLSNDGTNWYGVVGSATSAAGNCPTGVVCPDDYGAIHDGSSHLLSSRYGSLAAAQSAFNGAYNFVTSLSQQIDYAAVKAASNAAFGADLVAGSYIILDKTSTTTVIVDPGAAYGVNALAGKTLFLRYYNGFIAQEPIAGNTATTITLSIALPSDFHCSTDVCLSTCGGTPQPPQSFDCIAYAIGTAGEHGYTNAYLNKPLYLPGGIYQFGADIWTVRNASGIWMYGAGRTATKLRGNTTVLAFDGLWYSRIEGIEFDSLTATATPTLDIDGVVPGHPYTTRTVQGNTFKDLLVNGDEGAVAMALCRLGSASAQCSENTFIDNHVQSADTVVLGRGTNALNNLWLGGNLQDFNTGFLLEDASFSFYRVAFQSTRGYAQISSGGADIDTSFGNVGQVVVDDASDSESLVHFKGGTGMPLIIRGLSQRGGSTVAWSAAAAFTLNQVSIQTSVTLGSKLYRVTTAGTSAGAPPIWPDTGTVADGTVVWTETEYANIVGTGSIDWRTVSITVPGYNRMPAVSDQSVVSVSSDYTTTNTGQQTIFADATAGNIIITLSAYSPPTNRVAAGQIITVKKTDTSANTVTIVQVANGACGANPDGVATVIPGGSVGFATFTTTRTGGDICWWSTSKSFGFASPGTFGGNTPGAGTFTTLTANTSLAINGGTALTTTNRTGTGNLVLAGSPTFIGTANAPNFNATTAYLNNGIAQYFFVTADFTTAVNTNFQLITGLTWTVPANTAMNIPFQCHLIYSQGTANDVVSFGIQDVTVAPTNIFASGMQGRTTTASTMALANLPTLTTTTATTIVSATPAAIDANYNVELYGLIEQPSNASSSAIQIQVKTATGADQVTVRRGSYCRIN